MGGCRCTFRSCENNSSNRPGMHFFHFPARHQERCAKWMEYSNNLNFVDLPESQLRNKVVCQEHFRDRCFMNYLHDKLTKTAVPTILKLDTGEILDYENNQTENRQPCERPEKVEATNRSTVLLNNIVVLDETEFVPQVSEEPMETVDSVPVEYIQVAGHKLLNAGASGSPKLRAIKPLKRLVRKKVRSHSHRIPLAAPSSEDDLHIVHEPEDDQNESSIGEEVERMFYEVFDLESNEETMPAVEESVDQQIKIAEQSDIEESIQQHIVMSEPSDMDEILKQHEADLEQYEQKLLQQDAEHETIKKQLAERTSELREKEVMEKGQIRQINAQKSSIQQLKTQNKSLSDRIEEMNKTIEKHQTDSSKSREYQLEIEAMTSEAASKDTIIETLSAQIASQGSTINEKMSEIETLNKIIESQKEKLKNQAVQLNMQKSEIAALQQQQKQLAMSNASLQGPVSTTSPAITSNTASARSKPEKMAPMSKPHLFNGIKRYLNPSMVALLRMEMFGEAEREYKQDERDIAMELMRLPEPNAQPGSVYDFMRSEWRFRLPPRNDVLQWIQERDQNAQNVDSDWDDC